ncbi:MAG TPA: SipW-dependent-type signal peptide-containing protein [Candidatus Eisenbergiella merdigallinarum]|uniref:SipW-dependent-type signal peptide-containing protein n=1 Tax=Candidatus Eisenbergiella merdigallinarum TaxID=2838552 RepID=A0A9D2SDH7_9FIRM|nr:SipW-dependent-type signal peptide-containing protein [Candidatus Eisenbergiella merdigallinarum]
MKARAKILSLALAGTMIVSAGVFGTMAYLTDTKEVKNTFTVGNVSITLDEAKVNLDGTYETDQDNRVTANEYKLMPGHHYIKDPTVTVEANSEDAYIRALVTVSNADAVTEVLGDIFEDEVITELSDEWDQVGGPVEGEGTLTYEFRYKEVVTASDTDIGLAALFTGFTIPGAVDNEGLESLAGMRIDVVAQAIQADGFADAGAAWNAFKGESTQTTEETGE